jgi:hypothetical protein
MVTLVLTCHVQVWPTLGLHFATLCKLENLLGHVKEAVVASDAAVAVLQITHPETTVIDDLRRSKRDMLKELEQTAEFARAFGRGVAF